MKTPTNHEDNHLMREAAKNQYYREKQSRQIYGFVAFSLHKLEQALMEDFSLTLDEAQAYIRLNIPQR